MSHNNHSRDLKSFDVKELENATAEIKRLEFKNPGRFMENFDPERSSREMRKVSKRLCPEAAKKNMVYNESGLLIVNEQDLCDCLDSDCTGCHFPCPKCGSGKCGAECRCNRRWYYQDVEIEGTNHKLYFPPNCLP